MLRIVTLRAAGDRVTLELQGRVIGPWVEELRRACQEPLAAGASLVLDAGDVAFVDRDGLELLRSLIDEGVAVANCPPFVTEQLRALSPC